MCKYSHSFTGFPKAVNHMPNATNGKKERKKDVKVREKDEKHKYRGKKVKKGVKENLLKRKSVIPTWGWGFLT